MAKNWMEEQEETSFSIKPSEYHINASYSQCDIQLKKSNGALSKANALNSSKPMVFTGGGYISACIGNIQEGIDGIKSIKGQVIQAVREQQAAEQANRDLVDNLTVEDLRKDFKDMFGRELSVADAQRILVDLRNAGGDPPLEGESPREEDNSTIRPYNPSTWDRIKCSILGGTTAAGIGFGKAITNTGAGIVTLLGKYAGNAVGLFDEELAQTVFTNTGAIVEGLHSIFNNPYDDINSHTSAYIDLNAENWLKEDAVGTNIIADSTEFLTKLKIGQAVGKNGAAASIFLGELGENTAIRLIEGFGFDSASDYGAIIAGAEAAQMVVRGKLMSKTLKPIERLRRLAGNTMINATDPVIISLADSLTSERSFNEAFERQGGWGSIWESLGNGAIASASLETMGNDTKAKFIKSQKDELKTVIKELPGMFREIVNQN